jgi:threonine/homoserine/homoserine lactone efflux protein
MPIDMFTALVAFASAMAFTPGPNNIMVTASGVNFGFRRTVPHILGVTFGFVVLLIGCAAGLGAIFAA